MGLLDGLRRRRTAREVEGYLGRADRLRAMAPGPGGSAMWDPQETLAQMRREQHRLEERVATLERLLTEAGILERQQPGWFVKRNDGRIFVADESSDVPGETYRP